MRNFEIGAIGEILEKALNLYGDTEVTKRRCLEMYFLNRLNMHRVHAFERSWEIAEMLNDKETV